jgi:alpha-beta hydrolase superfamily lysophospholipase
MMIGELDDITTVAQQQTLFENLPVKQKRLMQHGEVGHLTHYEVPAAIAKDIEQWASEVGESRK